MSEDRWQPTTGEWSVAPGGELRPSEHLVIWARCRGCGLRLCGISWSSLRDTDGADWEITCPECRVASRWSLETICTAVSRLFSSWRVMGGVGPETVTAIDLEGTEPPP